MPRGLSQLDRQDDRSEACAPNIVNTVRPTADSFPVAQRQYLFLTAGQWRTGLSISAVVAALAAAASLSISIWIGVTVFIAAFTVYHMAFASRYIVPLPHVAILVSALQYVLAAWAGTFFLPTSLGAGAISVLPYYLTYAGPVMLAIAVGWSCAFVRFRDRRPPSVVAPSGLLVELDFLFALGLGAAIIGRLVPNQGNLSFVVLLVASLRYIGVFGRMVAAAPGWKWRLAVALVAEILFAVNAAMFHPLLLWGMWTLAVYLYCFRPSRRGVMVGVIAASLILPALQEAKWRFRGNLDEEIASGDEESLQASFGQSVIWLQLLANGFWHTLTLKLGPEFLSDTAMRYNQGWIVTRVMFFVPALEPYAGGETLREAVIAAALPRVAAPEKRQAGGQELMLRYAGMELGEGTSMDLGYAGEMYANFGPTGGVLACGLYAFAMGLCFRFFCRRAFDHAMWWSIAPFIFFPAVKAEDDIAFVLNWAVKGSFVLMAIVLSLPNLRRALFSRVRTSPPFASPAERVLSGLPSR
jgi:hypothetical protein